MASMSSLSSATRSRARSLRLRRLLGLALSNAPRIVPGVAFSDHLNYWHAGYDAVMITDTAFYRNPHYHAPSDTPDTLDYARMAQVVDGVRGAIGTLVPNDE
jgi:hypothetical protein